MKKYLVIGNPIEHSLSPKLHNYWFNLYNIDSLYKKKEVQETDLEKIISQVKENKISGINVTVPFKKTIIKYLDTLSEVAKKTQSVNTIFMRKNKIYGHNTDCKGFERSLIETGFNTIGKTAFIIGAGGVERIVDIQMNKDERAMFNKSVDAVKILVDACKSIDNSL